MEVRNAAVAGLFYEADQCRLRQHITSLLEEAPQRPVFTPQALIVPHAGYMYSGQTAARAYRLLAPLREQIRRVVLLGPAHRVYLEGMAVPSAGAFATPLGDVPLDRELLDLARALPGVSTCDEAHREEHSLEVQLPFLQSVLKRFTLAPVVVGQCDAPQVANLVDALWGGPETLLLVSTDLSHFHNYEAARQLDKQTCDRLLEKASDLSGNDACGARALNGLMCSRHCATLQVDLLARCNSGDTAGNKERVVGYGAYALH